MSPDERDVAIAIIGDCVKKTGKSIEEIGKHLAGLAEVMTHMLEYQQKIIEQIPKAGFLN